MAARYTQEGAEEIKEMNPAKRRKIVET